MRPRRFGTGGGFALFWLWWEGVGKELFFGCLLCWLCFSPVASRVSPRRPSYFFLRRQKKVTKKKASHVRAASRSLALLAAFGTLANSLRSNSASVLIRTLLRCSARPNGGGYHTARPLREPRPNGLFAALTSRGLGLPHSSRLTSHKGTARRATTPDPLTPTTSFLRPHSSLLPQGNHKGCPYTPQRQRQNPNSVIPRAVAESMSPCTPTWMLRLRAA